VNLALIGNCNYQALIDDCARVQWLCWPRFDSSFVFGGLLDDTRGGEFSIAPRSDSFTSSQSYLPNTNVLRTEFHAPTGSFEVIDFAPRFKQYDRFFKPNMLVRRVRPLTDKPVVRVTCRPTYDYGRLEPTRWRSSNHIQWHVPDANLRLTTDLPLSYIEESRPIVLDDTAYLVLTWGPPLEASLAETCENFLGRTKKYWETWVRHGRLPDRFQEEVVRSALVLKLHQYEDTGAITAATTTSLPEHDGAGRNWDYRFCWLRDACFTLGALRRLGQFEEMEAFVKYLTNIGENMERQGGALQPVYGISGEKTLTEITLDHLAGYRGNQPVRAGNAAYAQRQHDVYGEMLAAISPMFLDLRFNGTPGSRSSDIIHRMLAHVETTLEEPDAGLWEKRDEPRVHAFTLLMHWAGAKSAARIGRHLNDVALSQTAHDLEVRARALIEERCWREDAGFYADATDGDNADASLFMLINTGFLSPDHPHAARHVDELARRLACKDSDHLFYRYLHHDGIGETVSTFTVCGYWYAEALARLGRLEQAEEMFTKLLAHSNHVGLLAEDIDPRTGAQWGNFPQTYSHVGVINTAFAICPDDLAIL